MLYRMNSVKLIFICHFIRAGFSIEHGVGMVSSIQELLIGLRCPLKLTIVSCWSSEENVEFLRHITNGPKKFSTKVVNGADEIIPNIFDRHQEAILADLSCHNTPNILSKISRSMFGFFKIIIFDSMHNNSMSDMDTKIQNLFRNSAIMPMSQVFFISEDHSKNKYGVKQVYRIAINEPLIIDDFAFADVDSADLTLLLRRRNLEGHKIKASMVILNNDSLNHLDDYRDIHIDAVSKVCYILTNDLIRFLNASVKYSVVSTWGARNHTTGQWSGMIGEMLTDQADIGATPLFFIVNRVSLLEYIARPTQARGGMVFRAPKLSYTDNIFLLPFNRLLWMCLFLLVLVIALLLCGAVLIELKVFKTLEVTCRINDVYMIIYGAMCQQGSPVSPNSVTGQLIMANAFITLMFLYVSYSANIVALLQSPSNQIKTLEDLYESKIGATVEDTVYNRYYFPLVAEPLRKRFYEEKLLDKDGKFKLETLEQGIKNVREGHAFYTEFSSAYKIISETFFDIEKCGLQELYFFQFNLEPWYVIQKNSSYKDLLKIGMMRIQEHGLQQKENLRYYTTKPKCLGCGGNFLSASLVDTSPAMILLGYGFGITLVVFICEHICAKFSVIRRLALTMVKKTNI